MHFFIWTIVISILLFVALLALGEIHGFFKKSYYIGIQFWSQWTPVIALLTFVTLVGFNINQEFYFFKNHFNLRPFFSTAELVVIFLLSPLLLTRATNIIAGAIMVYSVERLFLSGQFASNPSLMTYLGSLTVLTVLADRMPWFARPAINLNAVRLREILIMFLSLAAIGLCFATLIGYQSFGSWMASKLGLSISRNLTIAIIFLIFGGWLSVAMGLSRHFILPVICLPSLLILAFVTNWPNYLLIIPFAACLALSLAVVDRRIQLKR